MWKGTVPEVEQLLRPYPDPAARRAGLDPLSLTALRASRSPACSSPPDKIHAIFYLKLILKITPIAYFNPYNTTITNAKRQNFYADFKFVDKGLQKML
jgi:hypothetical protein